MTFRTAVHRIIDRTLVARWFAMLVFGLTVQVVLAQTAPPAATNPATRSPSAKSNADRARGATAAESYSALMFQVMMAEIAVQRGQLAPAFATFMSVADETRDARYAKRAAEIAFGARSADDALGATRLWSKLAPADRDADSALIGLLIETGRFPEAEPRIAARLKESPNPSLALDEVQALYSRAKNRTEAFASLDRLAQPYAAEATTHLALARAAFAAGLADRATREAREALRIDPKSEVAAMTLAQLLVKPAPAEAADTLKEFTQRNPTAFEARIALARLQGAAGRYDDARATLEALVAQQPENLDALLALGGMSYQARDLNAAQSQVKRFIEVAKKSAPEQRDLSPAYFTLSQIAEDRRQFDEAIDWMKLDQGSGQTIAVQARIAQLLAKSGRIEQALAMLKQITPRDDTERAQIVSAQALALREAKRYQAAFDTLADALKSKPDSADLLYDYALAAEKINRVDDMERALRRVIEIRPGEPQAYNALGYSLADRKTRIDEARTLVEKALTLSPSDAFIVDSMGWVEYRAGNLPRAVELLERAYSMRADAEIAAHFGEVLWVSGDRKRAEALWRSARERDPNNETLVDTVARYKQP